MGVQGLWQLLQPTGHPVTLESLEGKILAIDVSVWLHQAMKGMRDQHGNAIHNAHLHVLFNRVCKLLFYRIRPVFVFDGGVPELKKSTLAKRRQRRVVANVSSDKVTQKLVTNLLKHHAVNAVLGKQSSGRSSRSSNSAQADMFVLNPIPETDRLETNETDEWEDRIAQRHQIYEDFEELESIDVNGDDFKVMPAEIKHEILTELKSRQKQNSWAKLDTLPEKSTDFSQYQMSKLMKSSKLSQRLDDVRKELNTQSVGSIGDEMIKDKLHGDVEARRVVSEEATHYILIRGLKNAASKIAQNESKANDSKANNGQDSTQMKSDAESTSQTDESQLTVDLTANMESADIISRCKLMMKEKRKEILKDANELRQASIRSAEPRTVGVSEKTADRISSLPVTNLSEDEDETESKYFTKNETVNKGSVTSVIGRENDAAIKQSSAKKSGSSKQPENAENLPDVSNCGPENVGNLHYEIPDLIKDISEAYTTSICAESSTADRVNTKSRDAIADEVILMADKISNVGDDEEEPSKTLKTVTIDLESSSDEDDFLEVSINPADAIPDDDLFPASIFETRVTLVEKPQENTPKSTNLQTPNINAESDRDEETKMVEVDDDVIPHVTSMDESDWTKDLKNQYGGLTSGDLNDVQMVLEAESVTLAAERGKQERLAASITEQVNTEAQELLHLFGVPYIVAPTEAESQCAYLELTNQTHGTITDDSDIWLFGGKNVYKNFFNQSKQVELFKAKDIETDLMLDRDGLIRLAYLCGSDYTEGIQGVGPVTGLELLSEFPGKKLEGLQKLFNWWSNAKKKKNSALPEVESKVKAKLRSFVISPGFPNASVYQAYILPPVDESREKFTWAKPDLDLLREFSSDKMVWSRQKADDMLLPMLKKQSEQQSQTRITSFFQGGFNNEVPRKVKSDRVNRILKRMRGDPEPRSPSPKGKATPGLKVKSSKRSAKTGSGSNSSQKAVVSVNKKGTASKNVKSSSGVAGGGGFAQQYSKAEVDLSENSSESDGDDNDGGNVQAMPFNVQEILKLASKSTDEKLRDSKSTSGQKKKPSTQSEHYLKTAEWKSDDVLKSKRSTKRKSTESLLDNRRGKRKNITVVRKVEESVMLSSDSE